MLTPAIGAKPITTNRFSGIQTNPPAQKATAQKSAKTSNTGNFEPCSIIGGCCAIVAAIPLAIAAFAGWKIFRWATK